MTIQYVRWQPPSSLQDLTGYGDYILEIDEGVNNTKIVHAIHLESIDCFWDVSTDYYDESRHGFIHKDEVLRFVPFQPVQIADKDSK